MKHIFFTILILLLISPIYGQDKQEHIYQSDTLNIKQKIQLIALPIAFYSPETSFGIGAGLQTFLRTQTNVYNSRESNILTTLIVTANKQLILDVRPQLYFNLGDLYFDGLFKYKLYPNYFWGIGNSSPESNKEEYNMRTIQVSGALLKRLPPNLNFGFEYRFEKHEMLEILEGGVMDTQNILGADGAVISGLSFVFNLDNRDDVFSAMSGNFMQLNAGFSAKVIGATHSYTKYIIDLRKYFPVTGNQSLATQVYFESNYGDIPFQTKAWLGGADRLRGYFKGRYIDDHMYVAQMEYRWRFHRRWGLAGFIAGGEVSDRPSNFFTDFHYSFGGGMRFKLTRSKATLVRLDVGIGKDGNNGIYFGVNEAF